MPSSRVSTYSRGLSEDVRVDIHADAKSVLLGVMREHEAFVMRRFGKTDLALSHLEKRVEGVENLVVAAQGSRSARAAKTPMLST